MWSYSAKVLFILIAMAINIDTNQNKMFAIYLPAEKITAEDILRTNLQNIKLKDNPIISSDNIIVYHENTHQIELTPQAYERIMQVDVDTPFIVCVGNERLYAGAIWSDLRSASFKGIVISKPATNLHNNIIQIKLGYPSASFYKGKDLRSNPKIFRALKQVHKLETLNVL